MRRLDVRTRQLAAARTLVSSTLRATAATTAPHSEAHRRVAAVAAKAATFREARRPLRCCRTAQVPRAVAACIHAAGCCGSLLPACLQVRQEGAEVRARTFNAGVAAWHAAAAQEAARRREEARAARMAALRSSDMEVRRHLASGGARSAAC